MTLALLPTPKQYRLSAKNIAQGQQKDDSAEARTQDRLCVRQK
jgi:hypothetical protein